LEKSTVHEQNISTKRKIYDTFFHSNKVGKRTESPEATNLLELAPEKGKKKFYFFI